MRYSLFSPTFCYTSLFLPILHDVNCLILSFGGPLDDYPHPELDFAGFKQYITTLNDAAPYVLGPVSTSGKDRPWVKTYRLKPDAKPVALNKRKCVIC